MKLVNTTGYGAAGGVIKNKSGTGSSASEFDNLLHFKSILYYGFPKNDKKQAIFIDKFLYFVVHMTSYIVTLIIELTKQNI